MRFSGGGGPLFRSLAAPTLVLLALAVLGPGAPPLAAAEASPLGADCGSGIEQAALLGMATVPIPPGDPAAIPDGAPCTGLIRPGALTGNGCTLNFIFRDGLDRLYVGTAGHCTSYLTQSMSVVGISGSIGTVVYRIGEGWGQDFALIRIATSKYSLVETTMCGWGGPWGGVVTEEPSERRLLTYGWGWLWGDEALRAKQHVRLAEDPVGSLYSVVAGTVAGGDSGAPEILADGRPFGLVTHAASPPTFVLPAAAAGGIVTRLSAVLSAAESALGFELEVLPGDAPPPPMP